MATISRLRRHSNGGSQRQTAGGSDQAEKTGKGKGAVEGVCDQGAAGSSGLFDGWDAKRDGGKCSGEGEHSVGCTPRSARARERRYGGRRWETNINAARKQESEQI
ncbi:hypothetical protein chiPu_0000726 [Chiloscyllium punctatum]|uniref:Uncharacterized protein n=1 Tax=Chiloscyllium punctatum TaxID=137246 RepID=A0A401RW27_CHIPU|nr:hypothetical protein [Chiloscyllium punctatum]